MSDKDLKNQNTIAGESDTSAELGEKLDKIARKIADQIHDKIKYAANNPESVLPIFNSKQLMDYSSRDWEDYIIGHFYLLFPEEKIPIEFLEMIKENEWDKI